MSDREARSLSRYAMTEPTEIGGILSLLKMLAMSDYSLASLSR
ncbi:hypothetical protein [Methylocaldum szegediense]|nr:hypothetical protein [Methylocaldum szegediense]